MSPNELVDLYEKIRKSKGYTHYELAKALGISQTQLSHYTEKPISTRELLIVALQELSGLSVSDFWDILKKEAKAETSRRLGRKQRKG